jgi:hypothetical protein
MRLPWNFDIVHPPKKKWLAPSSASLVSSQNKQAGLIAQSGPWSLVILSHALLPHNPRSCLLQS